MSYKCRLLMKRRREHFECETRDGGRGCIILGTPVCTLKKMKEQAHRAMVHRWIWNFTTLNIIFCCFVLIAAVGISMGTAINTTDIGAYLTPATEPGASPK